VFTSITHADCIDPGKQSPWRQYNIIMKKMFAGGNVRNWMHWMWHQLIENNTWIEVGVNSKCQNPRRNLQHRTTC
jgi:hypothetical protein